MDKVRTVSDTKRDFYAHHTRPINSVYRRIIDELMVEMHLLSVNVDFRYDPIYCLGVVTSFERFMQGYQPENDKDSIFAALCHSVGGNAKEYRQDAEKLISFIQHFSSSEELISYISSPTSIDGGELFSETIQAIANNSNFKYSRLFSIGLYTLIEKVDPDLVQEEKQRNLAFKTISEALHLPEEKMQKDLDLYRSNLEKIEQLLSMLDDVLKAGRKKREQKLEENNQSEAQTSESQSLIEDSNTSQE